MQPFRLMILSNVPLCLLQSIPVLFPPIDLFLLEFGFLLLIRVLLLINLAFCICFYDLLTTGLLSRGISFLIVFYLLLLMYPPFCFLYKILSIPEQEFLIFLRILGLSSSIRSICMLLLPCCNIFSVFRFFSTQLRFWTQYAA